VPGFFATYKVLFFKSRKMRGEKARLFLFLLFCKNMVGGTPLFLCLLELKQKNNCVRISNYFSDHDQQDVGHGWGIRLWG
jgi:hypothetical protein